MDRREYYGESGHIRGADGKISTAERWKGRIDGSEYAEKPMSRRWRYRSYVWLLILLVLLVMSSRPAQAEIKSVAITFKDDYGDEPGQLNEPEVTCGTSGVEVTDIDYSKAVSKWSPGVKVRVNVRLHASEDEFADNFNKSSARVSGATYVGVSVVDDDTLVVKVDYKPVVQLANTTRAGWNSARTRAVWRKVTYAPGYNLDLYADDKKVKSFKNLKQTYLDLAEYMKDADKTYFYEVKAVPTTSDEKKYMKEGDFVTSEDETVSSSGTTTVYSATNTGNGVTKNAWRFKNDKWYYINESGDPVTGWLHLNDTWYFMDQNGAMTTGWQHVGNDKWCYFNSPNGDMASNMWIRSNNDWYHVDNDGYMQVGWLPTADNLWYYMDTSTGKMTIGWKQIGDGWYLFGEDGIMLTDWQQRNGEWYYFDTNGNGRMLTGWQQIGGQTYYLDPSDGHMLRNTTVDGYTLGANGAVVQ